MISLFRITGILGLLILICGALLISTKKKGIQRKIYLLYLVGGILMLIYSLSIKDSIFIILQTLFIFSAIWGIIKTK
jgi:lipid-A-disaccharide synthase-like uncharacterized protein